jgi:S-adenosyl-L-methionine hydrolase (adenosine-forming)
VTHDVPRYDVRAGGLALARAAQYLAPGVVLAVVDPGVGTDRRPVAVEVGDGESVLVGPDNGLLAPAVAMVGGATRAFELTSAEHRLEAPGPTFDGRDVFAPAAAHLSTGVPLEELGPEIDPITLLPGILPLSRAEDGGIAAEVLWVDRFGNAQLNVDPAELAPFGERVRVVIGESARSGRRVRAFADAGPGEIGLITDSYGLVAVILDRRSAAEELGLDAGSAVRLEPFSDDDGAESVRRAPVASPVRLSARPGAPPTS